MILLRTDGGGASYNDERLRVVEKHLKFNFREELQEKIFKLHDHKGCLNVYWISNPNFEDIEYVNKVWESLCEYETKHYYSLFKEINYGL